MQVLNWMGEHPFLAFFLAGIVGETIIRVFRSGKTLAMKCPKCGFSNVKVEDDDE
jgi:hypothetical protein